MTAGHSVSLPTLAAPPILIRPWLEGDVESCLRGCADKLVQALTSMPDPHEPTVARWISTRQSQSIEGRSSFVAIATADGKSILGSIGIIGFEWKHARAEVGYWLLPEQRGRGFATLALKAYSAWIFDTLPIERIDLFASQGNLASMEVAKRCGYTYEGLLRSFRIYSGNRESLETFSLLRSDDLTAIIS